MVRKECHMRSRKIFKSLHWLNGKPLHHPSAVVQVDLSGHLDAAPFAPNAQCTSGHVVLTIRADHHGDTMGHVPPDETHQVTSRIYHFNKWTAEMAKVSALCRLITKHLLGSGLKTYWSIILSSD